METALGVRLPRSSSRTVREAYVKVVDSCDEERTIVLTGSVFRAGTTVSPDALRKSEARFGSAIVVEYVGRVGLERPARFKWTLWKQTHDGWDEMASTVAFAGEWQVAFVPVLRKAFAPDRGEVRNVAERVMTSLSEELNGLTIERSREVIDCLHYLIVARAARLRYSEKQGLIEGPLLPPSGSDRPEVAIIG